MPNVDLGAELSINNQVRLPQIPDKITFFVSISTFLLEIITMTFWQRIEKDINIEIL